MTIQEILNEHEPSRWRSFTNENEILRCCGKDFGNATKKAKRGDGHLAWAQFNAHVAEVLDERMQEREAQLRQLVRDMTDPGKCWLDHHGGCQEHGYLDLKPGELCPHAEAKQLLGDEPNGR